jgi:phenylpropionate dioxygenase-like ring-hydroxylating dioxygenase large terminal subunit
MGAIQFARVLKTNLKLFKSFWHLLCHRRELIDHSDFIKFDTPIGEIVIFNDNNNYVAFDNKCPHRGATIYKESYGNQIPSCKYHGWTYINGKIEIPNIKSFEDCNIEQVEYKKYKLDWCGDFLFVSEEPTIGLYKQLGSIYGILENISFNIDKRVDFDSYTFESTWQHAVENALEPYHIPFVHQDTLAPLDLGEGENVFDGINSIWYAPIGNLKIKNRLASLRKMFDIDFSYDGYMFIYIFPFSMLSSTFGYSYSLQNFFPHKIHTDKTNFSSRLLTANVKDEKCKKILDSFFSSTALINRKVFDEDHNICKLMKNHEWKAKENSFLSTSENKIKHFRECYLKFLDE